MTKYNATPEQWAQVEEFPEPEYNACLLDLRARVEALEAAQPNYPAKPDSSPASASSLVDRLASVGVSRFYVKAAIREVAAWLRDRGGYPDSWIAEALDKEASHNSNEGGLR